MQHRGEVFAVFDLPVGGYPGQVAVTSQVETQCADKLAGYSPRAADDPSIGLSYLYPTELSWRRGDRGAACIATSPAPSTGSLRGS